MDAFVFTPLALALLVAALVLGTAVGLIARGFHPRMPWWAPERLVRAAGIAFVVATIAGLVWPAPFLSRVGVLSDPRFDSVAGLLRGTIVLSWFLVALRLAGWPLGAAFAHGFLAPEPTERTEQAL